MGFNDSSKCLSPYVYCDSGCCFNKAVFCCDVRCGYTDSYCFPREKEVVFSSYAFGTICVLAFLIIMTLISYANKQTFCNFLKDCVCNICDNCCCHGNTSSEESKCWLKAVCFRTSRSTSRPQNDFRQQIRPENTALRDIHQIELVDISPPSYQEATKDDPPSYVDALTYPQIHVV